MMQPFSIGHREIGPGQPVYIIAEMSANHGQCFDTAIALVRAAKIAGADAIKLQTYKPETITLDSDQPWFRIEQGTQWDGRTLYQLYESAYTPWQWHGRLMAAAASLRMDCFSSPFDATAVDFLESLEVPAYKIASFELVDIPLLKKVGQTGKPVIASTGMASESEIESACATLRAAGAAGVALLKCTSAYPAPIDEMNLATIDAMRTRFGIPVGLSDHSLGTTAAVTAVALGASIIEKHLILDRSSGGPDSAFSLEPDEFAAMVRSVREAEAAIGQVHFGVGISDARCLKFRRSLFVVKDLAAGETITADHIRSIRPGDGLPTQCLDQIIGRTAAESVARGTPLNWRHVA